MELRKTSESVSRSFDTEGNATERVDNASYELRDANDNVVGNANIGNGYGNVSLNISGHDTIEAGEEKLKAMLGID